MSSARSFMAATALTGAFMVTAAALPFMGLVVEGTVAGRAFGTQVQDIVMKSAREAAPGDPARQQALKDKAQGYISCVHKNVVPSLGLSQAFTNWADRVSFLPSTAERFRDYATRAQTRSLTQNVRCLEGELALRQKIAVDNLSM